MAVAEHESFLFPELVPPPRPSWRRFAPTLVPNARDKAAIGKSIAETPWGVWTAALLLGPSMALTARGMDYNYKGNAWTGQPWLALACFGAAFVVYPIAILLCARQWRNRKRFGNPRLCGTGAIITVLLWTLYVGTLCRAAWEFVPYGLSLAESVEHQRLHPGIEIWPDGTGITMRMGFRDGVTERVRNLLRGRPEIRTIELSGPGGRASEGVGLAGLIRERGLDTRVQRGCASACAIAFLAGRRRELLATTGGRVGFHQPSILTPNGRVKADSNDVDESIRTSGASVAFVWRVNQTSHEELWRPSPSEFAAAGVPVVTVDGYELPGHFWGDWALTSEETLERLDIRGEVVSVLQEHDPDVLADVVRWSQRARAAARNDWMVIDRQREAIGRVLALRLSQASDAEVLKAGTYIRAALEVIRSESRGWCARLGDRPNLLYAARKLPGPPNSASDPVAPYGALLRRAYGTTRHTGWPEGIALPEADAPSTWSIKMPPRPHESCDAFIAWYAQATDRANPEGVGRLRARFAAFARTPVLTGTGREGAPALTAGIPVTAANTP